MTEHPFCIYCGIKVKDYGFIPVGVSVPPDAASVDHVKTRYERKPGEIVDKVLACVKCNIKRGTAMNRKHQLAANIANKKLSPTPIDLPNVRQYTSGMESVIPIKGKDGKLIAIVYYNIDNRTPEIYGVSKHGMDDIKDLLEGMQSNGGKTN